MKKGGIVERLQPVRLGEVSVSEHRSNFVQEGAVQAFCHAIILWCVSSGDFVLDSVLLKVLLDMASHVFTSSI